MATSKKEIAIWLEQGLEKGASHVIVAVDTFDYEDYPVYVMPNQNIQIEIDNIRKQNMTRIMEVYNLSLDLNQQLKEQRAYHP